MLTADLAPALDIVRLSLHLLAASIWVGGQFVLAGLLPTLRGLGGDAPGRVARAFGRLSWPAFAVLVATGVWNVSAVSHGQPSAWQAVLGAKIVAVALSGLAAYLHSRSTGRAGLAAWGSIAGVATLAALVLGVALAG
ncbi:MAG TPA: hypothetical protein VFP61_03910 [Acidimicrobiales bacterium]|nr:hypothetical protein [Acidimicrobiales bacterium]